MKIKFEAKDNKSNPTKQAKAFISFLMEERHVREEVKVLFPEKVLGKGADYFVADFGLLIEATQLIDNKDLAQSARWAITVNTLSKLIKQDKRFSSIKGLHSISTPEGFGLKTSQLKSEQVLNTKISKAVDLIVQSVLSEQSEVVVFGTKLKIEKVHETNNGIYFSTMGRARSINVAGIFHENLKNKFEKADTQLSLKKVNKIQVKERVLLIVNKYRLLTFDWDLFKGLSYSYKELVEKYKNIDEIWFQTEDGEGKYHHKLLYKKSLFAQFENMDFSNMTSQDYGVFAKWFSPLEELDDKKKQSLIEALKILLQHHSPHEIFPDPQTRIEMVRYGRWLAENNKRSEANWLVEQFLDDPDPLDPPTQDKKDYGNELHESIKNASKPDMHAIQTVKGHLAWTVQLLALRRDFLKEAYTYTQGILRNTKHLYLVLQWLFPLIEISNRRFWLKELDRKLYNDFRKLSFELLGSYSKYPDIAKGLVHIFHYFRDLTTEEAKEVLSKLESADDYEALLLYFALFRQRHFKEDKYNPRVRNYNPEFAQRKLEDVILSNDGGLLNLRSGIAWNIWKILSEDGKEFETLKPLINKFLSTPYDNHLYHNFERIVEDHLDKHSDECIDWFSKITRAANEYLNTRPDEGRNVWLGTKIGKVLRKLAATSPEELINTIQLLYEMWMKGAYIGTISEIFSSYKAIDDPELWLKAKDKFKELYAQMKSVNEKLEEVDWEE